MPKGKTNFEYGEERRRNFLEAVVAGRNLREARDLIGISQRGYIRWRVNDQEWAGKVDVALGRNKEPGKWDGSLQSGRKEFFGFDTYYHQARILDAIETAKKMDIILVLLPPEHGKSTTLADYCSIEIGRNPDVRIGYISEGMGLARKAIGRQQRRMTIVEQNPLYIARFGPFRHPEFPWTADYFRVAKSTHDEQDYTMEARGNRSAIAGSRIDRMVLDDIQARRSLNQTDEILGIIQQDHVSRVGREGSIIGIGTRVGEGDVWEQMIEQGLVNRLIQLPATDVNKPIECPLGKECEVPEVVHEEPLCPEMWDTHSLAKRRKQVGELAWWRNYQQRPRSARTMTFTEEVIDPCKNTLRTVGPAESNRLVIAGLDPALGGGNSLTVCAATGFTLEVLDVDRQFGLAATEQILAIVSQAWKRYHFRHLLIEINAFQRGLARDQRLMNMARLHGFQVHEHTTGYKNKMDEFLGVASMRTSFDLSEIDLPWGDAITRERIDQLIQELLRWRYDVPTRKVRQDCVMSFWFCWLYWMRRRLDLARGPDSAMWKRAGSPFGEVDARSMLERTVIGRPEKREPYDWTRSA